MLKTGNRDNEKIILFTFLLINLGILIFFGIQKQGFDVDELYSFGLSNSYYEPFLQIKENVPLSGAYFKDYLTVQENERFSYGSVYANQTEDVHPPLYYFLFHTIASVTPNLFTKWTGIALNIFLFIITWWIVYKLARLIFSNKIIAMTVPLLWGTSPGAISSVVFIRMYVLMTLFVSLTAYLHLKSIYTGKLKTKMLVSISVVTFLGLMTHYYFVVFAFFLSAFFVFYRIYIKEFKSIIWYTVAMFSGLGLGVWFYPALIDHIFLGYRGTEAVENIVSSTSTLGSLFASLNNYINIISESLFNGYLYQIIAVLLVATIVLIIVKRKQRPFSVSNSMKTNPKMISLLALLVSIFGYTVIVSQVAPYQSDRYIFAVFPLLVVVIMIIVQRIVTIWTTVPFKQFIVLITLIAINFSITLTAKNVNYLFLNREETLKEQAAPDVSQAILMYDSSRVTGAQVTNASQYLLDYDTVYVVNSETGISQIEELNLDTKNWDIYFGYAMDTEEFPDKIIRNTKFINYTLLNDGKDKYYFQGDSQ